MTYTDKDLQKIEKLASLYMSISDMAVILDVPEHELRRDINSHGCPARHAYRRGKTSTKLELRKQEVMLARVGSPLALDNCHKALLDMEDDE